MRAARNPERRTPNGRLKPEARILAPPKQTPEDPSVHPQSYTSYEPAEAGGPVRVYEPVPKPPRPRFTAERIVRLVLTTAVLILAAYLVWFFAGLVVYLLVGVVLAYLMKPITDRVQGLGIGRIPAILVTFLVVFGTISILLTYLVPFVGRQITELSQQISPETVRDFAVSLENRVIRYVPAMQPGTIIDGLTGGFETLFQGERITSTMSSAVGVFTDIFYAVIVIPFVTFFVLKDGTKIRRGLLSLVPNRYFELTLAIMQKIERNIGRYFRALLLQCTSIAAVAWLLLSVAGLNYALAVGIFTGLANSIPYFGPLMGLLAGTLVGVAQTGDFSLFPGILVAMAITQAADNILFQPLIFSRAARAHPLVILFVVLIGAQLIGIVGMLIAIPVTTVLRVAGEQVLWSVRNYRILRTA